MSLKDFQNMPGESPPLKDPGQKPYASSSRSNPQFHASGSGLGLIQEHEGARRNIQGYEVT